MFIVQLKDKRHKLMISAIGLLTFDGKCADALCKLRIRKRQARTFFTCLQL